MSSMNKKNRMIMNNVEFVIQEYFRSVEQNEH